MLNTDKWKFSLTHPTLANNKQQAAIASLAIYKPVAHFQPLSTQIGPILVAKLRDMEMVVRNERQIKGRLHPSPVPDRIPSLQT